MNLLDLPEEMIGEVLKRLDTKSKLCVWDTCEALRRALIQSRMMRRVALRDEGDALRISNLAELGPCVEELDLSGLTTLTVESAKLLVRLFPNLRSLDITHTNIPMLYVSDLCDLCPRLKCLAACFDFPHSTESSLNTGRYRRLVEKSQRAFRSLVDIRFLYDSCRDCDHPLQVLNMCDSLRHLCLDIKKYSCCNHNFKCSTRVPPTLLTVVVRRSQPFDSPLASAYMKYLDSPNWQGVLVCESDEQVNFSMTEKLLNKHTGTADYGLLELNMPYAWEYNTSYLYMWHSNLEKCRPDLYDEILDRVCAQTLHVVCHCEGRCADRSRTRFLVRPCVLLSHEDSAEPPKLFNLDEWMEPPVRGQLVRVSVTDSSCPCLNNFDIYSPPVPRLLLDFRSTALLHLSYLSIHNCKLDSPASILFENCKNLRTLLLIWTKRAQSGYSKIMENLHLSVSIQNVMYVEFKMNVNASVCALALCPSLRHVQLDSIMPVREPCYLPTAQTYSDFLVSCPDIRSFALNSSDLSTNTKQNAVFAEAQHQLQRNVVVSYAPQPWFGQNGRITVHRYCDEFNISDPPNLFRNINLKYDYIREVC